MNIHTLPNPEIIKNLYKRYYVSGDMPCDYISSHWKQYCSRIKVSIDQNGNIVSFKGYGFGDLQPTHPLNRFLKYLCNLTYFVRFPYKKDLLFLIDKSALVLKKIGSFFSYDCFRQLCSLCMIRRHLKSADMESFEVFVIGDGYGFLSAVLKRIYPLARLTLLDIGKVLLFQAVNLQKVYPQHSHSLLEGETGLGERDFLYVAAQDIEKVKGKKYNLMINIASMGEMNYETIRKYFKFMRLNSTTDNLFYCCNRERKRLPGGEVIEFQKYPWLNEDRNLIDEACPFYKYQFSIIPPFIHRFDGLFLHRLTNLKVE